MNFPRIALVTLGLTAGFYVLLALKAADRIVAPWQSVNETPTLSVTRSIPESPIVDSLTQPQTPTRSSQPANEPSEFEPDDNLVHATWRISQSVASIINSPEEVPWTLNGFYSQLSLLKGLGWPDGCPVPFYLDSSSEAPAGSSDVKNWHYNPKAIKWLDVQIGYALQMNGFVDQTKELFAARFEKPARAHLEIYNALRLYPEERTQLQTEYMQRVRQGRSIRSILYDGTLNKFRFWNGLAHISSRERISFFWIRRFEDGTADDIAQLLTKVLDQYAMSAVEKSAMAPVMPPPPPQYIPWRLRIWEWFEELFG